MSEIFMKFRSNYLAGTTDVTIITPNPPIEANPDGFYESDKKYPVLWVFHGGYATFADWITYTNIARLAIQYNFILVAPNEPNQDFMNQPYVGEGFNYYDFFLKELMPWVYNTLPASKDPMKNYLAGNSMGTATTWQYGLLHPELFGYIAPLCNQPLDYRYLEPYRDMKYYEFREYAKNNHIPAAYGLFGAKMHTKELNAICKYPTVGDYLDSIENTWPRFEEAAKEGRLPQHIFLPCGSEKRDQKIAEFRRLCDDLGVKNITFDYHDEFTHHADFWERSIAKFIEFIGLEKVRGAMN